MSSSGDKKKLSSRVKGMKFMMRKSEAKRLEEEEKDAKEAAKMNNVKPTVSGLK